MTKPILYYLDFSPPVRAVKLTIAALGLDVEYVVVNTLAKEQYKPEYLKLNPQHTVPTLDDNGKIIWDSHAICAYLVGKYAKNDSLYSKDLYVRARIDQRLHFDSGIIFPKIIALVRPILYGGATEISSEIIENVIAAYDMLETFLKDDLYLVGNSLTIADFCCVASISSLMQFIPIDTTKCSKLQGWINRMSSLSYYDEANGKNAAALGNVIKEKMEANKTA